MRRLSIPSTPERQAVAIQLLKVLAVCGVVVALIDFFNGNTVFAAGSVVVVVSALVVLRLAKFKSYAALPQQFVTWMLFGMYMFGTIVLMPQNPEKAVWSTVFPFAYFHLAGLRAGVGLTAISFIFTLITYAAYQWLELSREITAYGFAQTIGAFALCAVFAYLYEKIRTEQEFQLKHSSECDPLTGLLNRRGFSLKADSVMQQAMRFQHPFAVVLIDLDNFKLVNDIQGHEAGDLLLKEVAVLLRSQTRSADIVSRWGGEEFVLLLTESDLRGAQQLSTKICSAISSSPFASGSLTASLGVAVHEHQEPLEETIKRADQAMYKAKQTGKNKVEILVR